MFKLFLVSSFLLLSISFLKANIINVPNDQPTIQAGIDSASIGDTVLVQPGIYIENINFNGKNILVSSIYLINNDTSTISQTIIDGNNDDSVVKFMNGEDSTACLIGFTLRNGLGQEFPPPGFIYYGGGIYCQSASPTLKHLIIKKNTFTSDGGGIYFDSSIIRLSDTMIQDNYVNAIVGGSGGGIFVFRSTGKIENVLFKNNKSNGEGAAIAVSISNVTLKNIHFLENYSNKSGASISGYKSNIMLQNITSNNNFAALSGGGIHCIDNTSIKIINSIFWNDLPNVISFHSNLAQNSVVAIYSNIQGGIDSILTNNNGTVYWLDGNIDLYPQFLDTTIANFSLSSTSPCIDAGIQDTLITYNINQDTIIIPTINYLGLAPDMGAFEFDPATTIYKDPNAIESFVLYQNYPNPFNSTTTIKFSLNNKENVKIEIFNLLGQRINTLLQKYLPAGLHEIEFIGNDLASGIYYYRIEVKKHHKMKKMILLK